MKKNKKLNWRSLETEMLKGIRSEQGQVSLKDTPFYPLAFHIEMPESAGFDNGHVSFRFHDFNIDGLDTLELVSQLCKTDKNKLHVALRWKDISLKAKYEVKATYASRITMDTAGNMQELDESYARAAGAADNGVEPLSPTEIDTMVTQARAQKDPINGTHHGPTLMSTYYKNNESYNDAFVISATLRSLWSNQGITTQMSRDTSSALNSGATVNSNTYGPNNTTYNQNAASQQTYIAMALVGLANKAKADGNTALYNQYSQAAIDASSFQKSVNTLGDGTQPPQMTGPQVYSTLNDKTATPQTVLPEEFANMLSQASGDSSASAGADEEATKNGWKVLNLQERKDMRRCMFLFREELNADKSTHFDLLWAGNCHTDLKGAQAQMVLTYNEEKATWNIKESDVIFPAFAMEVDDSMWNGKVAEIVRERLASMHFVKSLLQNKIQSGIQKVTEKVLLHSLAIPGIAQ